jgi:hypothetical protein
MTLTGTVPCNATPFLSCSEPANKLILENRSIVRDRTPFPTSPFPPCLGGDSVFSSVFALDRVIPYAHCICHPQHVSQCFFFRLPRLQSTVHDEEELEPTAAGP